MRAYVVVERQLRLDLSSNACLVDRLLHFCSGERSLFAKFGAALPRRVHVNGPRGVDRTLSTLKSLARKQPPRENGHHDKQQKDHECTNHSHEAPPQR